MASVSETNILKALDFLKDTLAGGKYMQDNPYEHSYRYEHTTRVASYGREIARAEGLDEEALVIGCILHDVSYCNTFGYEVPWSQHGRDAARIARPFLSQLEGWDAARVEEVCYGIAIHADGKSDFDGPDTALARSIADCDELDGYDIFRVSENIRFWGFCEMDIPHKLEFLNKRLAECKGWQTLERATPTATRMMRQRMALREQVYTGMIEQFTRGQEFDLQYYDRLFNI